MQLFVRAVELSYNKNEGSRRRRSENAKLDINLNENIHKRQRDEIKKQTSEIIAPEGKHILLSVCTYYCSDGCRIRDKKC